MSQHEPAAGRMYTVVMRCRESLIRIPAGHAIRIAPLESNHGNYELTLQQRSEQVPHIKTAIPRELWVEVKGPAPSIEVAIDVALGSANDYVRQLAVAANAWQGLLSVHLAYDSTDAAVERQLFQNWVVDERGLPRVAREIDPGLMYRFLVAIARMSQRDRSRLVRAVMQYTDALQHWKPGSELYALAHLYMGVEAITPIAIEREIARRGLQSRKQLEVELNGPPADSIVLRFATSFYRRAGGYVPSRLEPWARRELIFRGDRDTYRAAARASNQLEHGTAHHAEIHALAAKAVERTATYLREAMFALLQLEEQDRDQLTREPYASPLKSGGFDRQLLAIIKSSDGQVTAPDELYPYVRWEFNLVDYRYNTVGKSEMRLSQKITPFLAKNAVLTVQRIVFAGPTPSSHTNVEFDVIRGDKPKEEIQTKAGAQLAIDQPGGAEWAHLVGSFILNANAFPHLARFWVAKLEPALLEQAQAFTLAASVDQILRIVGADTRIADRRDECERLWDEAIGADDLRMFLSVAYSGEKGLVVPLMPPDGRAAQIADMTELRPMVDHTVQVNKSLASLLDELLEQRDQSTSP
jgi:hypothetical protein